MKKDIPVLGGRLENREHPNLKGWLQRNFFFLRPRWTLKMIRDIDIENNI